MRSIKQIQVLLPIFLGSLIGSILSYYYEWNLFNIALVGGGIGIIATLIIQVVNRKKM